MKHKRNKTKNISFRLVHLQYKINHTSFVNGNWVKAKLFVTLHNIYKLSDIHISYDLLNESNTNRIELHVIK